MSKKRDPFRPREARVHKNPVTGKLETTVLDDVQLAFESIKQHVDGRMLRLSNADNERLARRLMDMIVRMLPHTDGPDGAKPL